MSHFSKAVSWRSNWQIIQPVGGGGQAHAFEVRAKAGGGSAFLKVLKDQGSIERRSRFYREAVTYDALSHAGLPSLIETNSQDYGDRELDLYLVTEFVSGPPLSKAVTGPLGFDQAAAFILPFTEILTYLHENGTVHRDIKPDNIMLKDGRLEQPILVDLGIAYRDADDGLHTDVRQEIGNRFLRLPELSAGSFAKQDPASDVTFAAHLAR